MESKQDAGRLPHWSIMMLDPMTDDERNGQTTVILKGVRYHCKGGPTSPGTPYKVAVESDQKFRSSTNVSSRKLLARIDFPKGKDGRHLTRAEFNTIMARFANGIGPQQCQKWVVCFLAALAAKGYIAVGVVEGPGGLAAQVKMGEKAAAYEALPGKYPQEPVGITLPASWPKPAPSRPASAGSQKPSSRPSSKGSGK